MSLRIFIDKKSQKVVFAEAGKDFVDFIFQIMQLPLMTVTKLLNDKHGMVGCFGALYKGIQSLDSQYYGSNLSEGSVLNLKTCANVPLLSINDLPTKIYIYKCKNCNRYKYNTDECNSTICWCLRGELILEYSFTLQNEADRNVKQGVFYIVKDDLEVKPVSIDVIKSLVKDFDCLEEKRVKFGREEGLALLKASLENEAVLTTVFLGKKG